MLNVQDVPIKLCLIGTDLFQSLHLFLDVIQQ